MTLIEDRPTVSSHAHAAKKNTMGRTFVKWMRAQDKINNKCLFDYYTEFDYLKEIYYA